MEIGGINYFYSSFFGPVLSPFHPRFPLDHY
jgi:hypothetical protein